MAYQPKSYRKFMAASLTAVMVASAVSPAFAAEAAKFSDVPVTDDHATNIALAEELGFIKGYEDGTFKPYTNITRGQVVQILARYLQKDGKVDTTGVTPFDDVKADSKVAGLYEASLVVKKLGVFTGTNGNLNAADPITRQQMAKVLVEGFGLKGNDKDVAISDLDKAAIDFRNYITILAQNEITTVTEYNPTGNVQRGQFASFIIRTVGPVENGDATVTAVNGAITYKFAVAPAATPTAADFAVSQTINGGTATSVAPTVTYDEASKTATLTVPSVAQTDVAQNVSYSVKYKDADAKTASFVIAAPTAAATVVAAGTAADKVYVFFNTAVDATTGTDVGNYRVDRDVTPASVDPVVTPSKVELNTTAIGGYGAGQVATLTFPAGTLTAGQVGSVRVANVKSNGVVIPTTTIGYAAAVATDTTAPTFTATTFLTDGITSPAAGLSIKQGGTATLTASPVDTAGNFVVGAQYRILGSDGAVKVNWTKMDAQNAPFDALTEPVKASIATSSLTVGTYTVQVRATDAATNTSLAGATNSTATLTILPANGDVTAPNATTTAYVNYSNFAVTGAKAQGAKTVRVEGVATDTTNLTAAAAGVAKVEYRVRAYNTVTGAYTTSTNWTNATATDGSFGGASEGYFFVTPALTIGSSYVIDVRATDIYGNVGPITQANDGVGVAVNGTTNTVTTPGLAAPVAGTFTIAGDAIAPVAGTLSTVSGFTLGTTATPSNVKRVQLQTTGTDGATDNSVITGVEFAVFKLNGAGARELVRNFSSVGVTATDGDFDSANELYSIDYTLPEVSGEYVFEVVAIDAAGNRSAISAANTRTHILDVTPPTVTIAPNTATVNNKFDFIITFNEAVTNVDGTTAISAADFAVRNALGQLVGDLADPAVLTATSTLAATAIPNQYVLNISGTDQAFITAGNTLTIGTTSAGNADIIDLATNGATASYQIKSTDLE